MSGVGGVNVTGDNSISDEKGKQGYLERWISFDMSEIREGPYLIFVTGARGSIVTGMAKVA